jgi:hypothetical protein
MESLNPSRGRPVGVIGFGRFTPTQVEAFQKGQLDEAITRAKMARKPVLSQEEMYAALFVSE